jgi:hypothetical protein
MFDIALGVGEHIAQFAGLFMDPPAYWWKEWPEWLLTDEYGDILPIARPQFIVRGVEVGLSNFINHVPHGKIRFNLENVSPLRRFTMFELGYILHSPTLMDRTSLYTGVVELTGDMLQTRLTGLGF